MKLSRLAETIPGSGILAISNAIKVRKSNGEEIHNYTVGDFDPSIFPIPKVLEEEIINAYRNGFTNYPAAEGNADLRASISFFNGYFHNLSYKPGEILVASGGRPLIYSLYQVIVDPGDKVIYPVPSWNNQYYTQFMQGEHCVIQTRAENNFMPTPEEIEPHLKGAILLALCSPQNPTGTCFDEQSLRSICDLVVNENKCRGSGKKKLYVLYDQMYSLLTYGDAKHIDPVSVCPAMRPYTIYIDAISKAFSATGVRIGWCFGPEQVLNNMKTLLTHIGAWAPMAEQKAVACFLSNAKAVLDYLADFKIAVVERLYRIYTGIIQLKQEGFSVDAIEPQASIYLTIKIDLRGDVLSFLLNKAGLALLPFSVFGAEDSSPWYRLSVGTCRTEDIAPMLQRLKEALKFEIIAQKSL
jgi:aspartate/methionine/tyrosine aminotransferase